MFWKRSHTSQYACLCIPLSRICSPPSFSSVLSRNARAAFGMIIVGVSYYSRLAVCLSVPLSVSLEKRTCLVRWASLGRFLCAVVFDEIPTSAFLLRWRYLLLRWRYASSGSSVGPPSRRSASWSSLHQTLLGISRNKVHADQHVWHTARRLQTTVFERAFVCGAGKLASHLPGSFGLLWSCCCRGTLCVSSRFVRETLTHLIISRECRLLSTCH